MNYQQIVFKKIFLCSITDKISPSLSTHKVTNEVARFPDNSSFKLFVIPLKYFIRMSISQFKV